MMPSSRPARRERLNHALELLVECAALIWVRMRAWPFGTTGKEKPMT